MKTISIVIVSVQSNKYRKSKQKKIDLTNLIKTYDSKKDITRLKTERVNWK